MKGVNGFQVTSLDDGHSNTNKPEGLRLTHSAGQAQLGMLLGSGPGAGWSGLLAAYSLQAFCIVVSTGLASQAGFLEDSLAGRQARGLS